MNLKSPILAVCLWRILVVDEGSFHLVPHGVPCEWCSRGAGLNLDVLASRHSKEVSS